MPWWKNPLRARKDDDFDREIAYHLEELTRANTAKGLSLSKARRQAIIEFGGREQIKQELREVHSSALMSSIGFNLGAAVRFFLRSPSFSAAIVLILALGIGANSAMFFGHGCPGSSALALS